MPWKFFDSASQEKRAGSDVLQIASTTAGLPTAVHGRYAAIRAGSATPYGLIGLVYDSTIGKWVSAPETMFAAYPATPLTTTSATFIAVANGFLYYYAGFRKLYDAGLRPQARFGCTLGIAAGTVNCYMGVGFGALNDGDAAASPTQLGTIDSVAAFDSGAHSIVSTTPEVVFQDWQDASMNAPAKDHVTVEGKWKCASSTLTIYAASVSLRWVSACIDSDALALLLPNHRRQHRHRSPRVTARRAGVHACGLSVYAHLLLEAALRRGQVHQQVGVHRRLPDICRSRDERDY